MPFVMLLFVDVTGRQIMIVVFLLNTLQKDQVSPFNYHIAIK